MFNNLRTLKPISFKNPTDKWQYLHKGKGKTNKIHITFNGIVSSHHIIAKGPEKFVFIEDAPSETIDKIGRILLRFRFI